MHQEAVTASITSLQRQLENLSTFDYEIFGVVVHDLQRDFKVGINTKCKLPLYSTFKLWVAVAVAIDVEENKYTWGTKILVEPSDLIHSHQPIASMVENQGSLFEIGELVQLMLTTSDNPSSDVLIRHLGGITAVSDRLKARGVQDINLTADERGLKDHAVKMKQIVAQLDEKDAEEFVRSKIGTTPNLATPMAVATALEQLIKGELLTEKSKCHLLSSLSASITGRDRLKAGLAPGWSIAHKTGSGYTIAGVTLSTNDIGFLTAPNGAIYIVVALLSGATSSKYKQETLLASTANLVCQWHTRNEAASSKTR